MGGTARAGPAESEGTTRTNMDGPGPAVTDRNKPGQIGTIRHRQGWGKAGPGGKDGTGRYGIKRGGVRQILDVK